MAMDTNDNNNQSSFPPAQAALLRALARNGAAGESSMYGYADVGSNPQLNGAAPSYDFTFSDAYPIAGLSSSFQEVDDPAALLEGLSQFEHLPPSNEVRTDVSNDHFASLLQAAATAGGEVAAQTVRNQAQISPESSGLPETSGFFKRSFPPETRSRRKRKERAEQDDDDGRVYGLISSKRRKKTPPPVDEDQLAREKEIWGDDDDDDDDLSTGNNDYQHSPVPTADARAVGVHSAAALFRRPTSASKKYTRPPMSKLFTSLELSPEQFLHLQAAAKAYMLDERYPERSDCVGNRGRGDTDMVKLKLFGCVKSFLEDDGWGERCFGDNAPGAETRKYKWPHVKNKLISLVTPLLRRMVTNERQRKYALETREEKRKANEKMGGSRQTSTTPPESPLQKKSGRRQTITSSSYSNVDPKLDQYHYNLDSTINRGGEVESSLQEQDVPPVTQFSSGEDDDSGIKYDVNIIQNGRRIRPKFILNPSSCPGFSSLVQHIHNLIDGGGEKLSDIKVLGANGLMDVRDEDSWKEAVTSVKELEWMDGDVKCVVHVEEKL